MKKLFEIKSEIKLVLIDQGLISKVAIGLGRETIIISIKGKPSKSEFNDTLERLTGLFGDNPFVEVREQPIHVVALSD